MQSTNRTILELKLSGSGQSHSDRHYQSHHTGIEIAERVFKHFLIFLTTNRTILELKYQSNSRPCTKGGNYQSHHTGIEMLPSSSTSFRLG